MHLVLSHAWTLDEGEHRDAYVAVTDDFEAFHRAQPGFRGRRLVVDAEDPRHFVNLRWWDHADDYARMITVPEYATWIERLSEHVEPRNPEKVTFEVVLDHRDPTVVDPTVLDPNA